MLYLNFLLPSVQYPRYYKPLRGYIGKHDKSAVVRKRRTKAGNSYHAVG